MPERTSCLGRGAVAASLSILLAALACGSSSSTGGRNDMSFGGNSGSNGSSGSGGSSGTSGSAGSSGSGGGAPSTCIVGTRGCLCDTTGGCASGLTCTPQATPQPSLCCSGSNCDSTTSGGIGATCGSVATAAACTPGITILQGDAGTVSPAPAGDAGAPGMGPMPGMGGPMGGPMGGTRGKGSANGTDGCGYPASSFTESTTLCAINAVGGGSHPAVIQVFYSDEHALTLGCATSAFPVSALPANPGEASYPQTGDPACTDVDGRPLRPVLYVTDVTADASCTAGDQQKGGKPYDPVAIFGTWKSATEDSSHVGTPATADPGTGNKWALGSGADAVPSVAKNCAEQGYSTELLFEVGLVAGHSYRFQVIVHDGDQNKGGDSGEACAVFCAGGSPCPSGVEACSEGDAEVCPAGLSCGEDGCCWPGGMPPDDASFSTPR